LKSKEFLTLEAKLIWLSNLSILRVSDEGYARNALCALNFISTFLFQCQKCKENHVEDYTSYTNTKFGSKCTIGLWEIYRNVNL